MGNGNDAEMRKKAEREVRELEEQIQRDNQRHQDEMKQKDEEKAMTDRISRQRTKVLKKKPGDSKKNKTDVKDPSHLFISLLGETGTGKTSLINSLKYTIDGDLKMDKKLATAPKKLQGGHTMESVEVCLTNHLSVIDNRGINAEQTAKSANQEDVIRRMEGKYEKGTVVWETINHEHANEEDKKSYCSVMVFSAHNPNVVRQYYGFIKRLRHWQGCFPLTVITHVDEVSSKDVRLALGAVGIGEVYEVANIYSGKETRDTVSPEHQLQLLELLKKSFNDGDFIFLRRHGFKSVE